MKNNNPNKAKALTKVMFGFNQLKPEVISLLTDAPLFGIASLEIHIMNGEIKRIVRRIENSIQLLKGENK